MTERPEIPGIPATYTEIEVAAALDVCPETIARQRRAGRITYIRLGGRIRYTAAHIKDYLRGIEVCRVNAASAPTGSVTRTKAPTGIDSRA